MNQAICTSLLITIIYSLTCSSQQANFPRLAVFSFDGFRSDYINPANTPNLYQISQEGVRGHMRSTFVTKTFPNHQSIVTGLYQQWHGIVNNVFTDPLANESFTVRAGPSVFWWDMKNISVPIYIANQICNNNRLSGSMQWPGSIAAYTDGKNIFKRYRVHYLQKYEKNFDWNKKIDIVTKWLSSKSDPANLVMLYFDEPDSTAHNYGPFSAEVASQIRRIDNIVGYFYSKLRAIDLNDRINLIFLSDHGMTEIRADRVLYLEKCSHEFQGLKFKLVGVSPVFSVIPISKPNNFPSNEPLVDSVWRALKECSDLYFQNRFKVYKQKDIPDSLHYKNNRRILPIFIMSDDGYELAMKKNNWKPDGYPVWGNHGYNNSLPSMRPLFIATGKAFKKKYEHPIMFDNVDLYPLMLRILRIPQSMFTNHNGTFEKVSDMLTDSNVYENLICTE